MKSILFDLDGTLLDTAPDLTAALNQQLIESGRSPMQEADIRPLVNEGRRAMLQKGFDLSPYDPAMPKLMSAFLDHYHKTHFLRTRPFAGVETLLKDLDDAGIRWGIVTNKLRQSTLPLLEALNWAHRAACVVTPDDVRYPKPNSEPVFSALTQLQIHPKDAVFIGDSPADVQAARGANVPCLVALFGYAVSEAEAADWGASGFLYHPEELWEWLDKEGIRRK